MATPSSDELTAQRLLDFQAWTSLISKVELIHHDDIDKISLVYDSFLSEFPLCYGYWKKYAEHKARLCGIDNAIQVFDKAVELAPYSVDVWVEYCDFGISSFEDPNDICRLFDKGLLLVGKDYLCYKIWDKYIEFEFSQQHWNSLANIYIQTLKFPTKKLHQYYESFKKLVAIWEEEMRCQGIPFTNIMSENEIIAKTKKPKDAEISHAISDLLDSSTRSKALLKYKNIGEHFYQRACELEGKIKKFEENIHRPYFHVKPLDESQLENWHQYLTFVEAQGDFDWAMKVYERCLISCANYSEFWMRYVDYLELKGAREIASDALERATHVFLKNSPQIHLFNAWFKEEVGDVDGLRAAFEKCDQHYESYLIEYVRRKANMERRLGNYTAACNIYKEALDLATEKRPDTLPMLYLHFARLQLMITNNVDAAKEVLLNGIQHLPRSKLLLEELILFAFMHEGAMQVETLDPIMAKALTFESETSNSLTAKECEDISRLYLEFIDFSGSIHDVRRAWNRHLKLFPHLVRVDYSLRNPSKSSTFWKMINDDEQRTHENLPQNSIEKHGENHLKEKLPEEPVTGHLEQEMENKVEKTQTRDACGENESSDQPMKDGSHHEQDHEKSQQSKPPSLASPSINPKDSMLPMKDGSHYEQDHEKEMMKSQQSNPPSLASPSINPTDSILPTKDGSHSSKGRQNIASPSNSEERREKSSSPRRRSHAYSDDRRHRDRSLSPRRHRDRSLSPRRHNSRWNSEERWHRDRRHRRNFRYQDNSRGRNRMLNDNQNHVVVVGNTGQVPSFQSTGFSAQTQASAQPYPQGQINPSPSNEQNSQLFNQMWQYYYYNQQQQQQLVQQQPPYQQMPPHQQNQQPIQNPSQQTLNLQYQQHMLSQLQQFQQPPQQPPQPPPSGEQPHSQEQQQPPQLQQQQLQVSQQLYMQMQQQQQQSQGVPHQDEMDPQKQQQQQQAYQYQQQYLLYLQQLQQYQYLQQQQVPPKQEGPENLHEEKSQLESRHGEGLMLVDPRSGTHFQQGAEVEGSHTSISPGVALVPQDQSSELEELEI